MPPFVVPSAGPLPAYGFLRRRRLLPLGGARRARSGVFNSFSALLGGHGEQDLQEGEIPLEEVAVMPPVGGNRRRSRRRGRRGSTDGVDDARRWSVMAQIVVVVVFSALAALLVLVLFAYAGMQQEEYDAVLL